VVGTNLGERRIRLADGKVVTVWTAAVAYDVDVIGRGEGSDSQELSETSTPHDVGLDDVDRLGV
jgi:hypothetical protein